MITRGKEERDSTREFRVFISYRRRDEFMEREPSFIDRLSDALRTLGASDVFVDTGEIKAGDDFDGTIFNAIDECDIFIELIGKRWIGILNERQAHASTDLLVREIDIAIRRDKDIVPLLIDGAKMPNVGDLPIEIRQLASRDGKSIASSSSAGEISSLLSASIAEMRKVRKLTPSWDAGYIVFATLFWLLTGVVPNLVGLWEFGTDVWPPMAAAWAGLFLWPLFFMPFILMALYRPFFVIWEAVINARTFAGSVTYASPVIVGVALGLGMTIVETASPQTPWTVHPKLAPECFGPRDDGPSGAVARAQYDRDRAALRSYRTDVLAKDLRDEPWSAPGERCWPGAFFYLTVPIAGRVAGPDYLADRPAVQQAFLRMLEKRKGDYKSSDAPYSWVFPTYALSFFLIASLLATAVIMAFVYVSIRIRRARDNRELKSRSEDLYLCLLFGFIIMMLWTPFRTNTLTIKSLYNCVEPALRSCETSVVDQMKNLAFFLLQMVALVPTTYMVFKNNKRLYQVSVTAVVTGITVCIAAILAMYPERVVEVMSYWLFWLIVSLFGMMAVTVLWLHFNPTMVRFREFKRTEGAD